MNPFDISRTTRKNIINSIQTYDIDQLNYVPPGFRNNLIWHLGHVVVSQQLLYYGLSGLPMLIDVELVNKYRRGTKPEAPVLEAEIGLIKEKAFSLIDQTEKDYQAGIFKKFEKYKSLYGLELNSIKDAVAFNNLHEALHLGYVLSIRKSL